MRLYNAKLCTPVGSTTDTAPKRSPSRTGLPPGTSPSAHKRGLEKHKAADNQVESKSSFSANRASKITSAFFDPFEIDDDMQFPRDPFFAKDGSHGSDGTSANEKLTRVVTSESPDLFEVSAEADEFIAFPEVARFIEPEDDLFNDANTWMTSSTLSTKFTNHEMNVAKLGRSQGGRAFAPFPSFGPEHQQDGFWPGHDQRPDEVFVRAPQPEYAFNGDMFSSFSDFVAEKPKSQLFQSASNATEAFDPFVRETTPQKPPAVRREVRADRFPFSSSLKGYNYEPSQVVVPPINESEVFDPFAREWTPQEPPAINRHEIREDCFPISSLPQENNYVSGKANLRSVSRNAGREPLTPIPIQRKAIAIKSQNNPIVVIPTQESRFASVARGRKSDPARQPGTITATEKTAQERHPAAQVNSKREQVIPDLSHPLTPSPIQKKAIAIKSQKNPIVLLPTQESRFASVARGRKSEPTSQPGTITATEKTAQEMHPAAQLDSKREQVIPALSHPLTPIPIQKKVVAIKSQKYPIVLLPTPESRFASVARERKSEPASQPGIITATEKTAQERHPAAQLDSKREQVIPALSHPLTTIPIQNKEVAIKFQMNPIVSLPIQESRFATVPKGRMSEPSSQPGTITATEKFAQERHPAAQLDSKREEVIPTLSHPKRFTPSTTSTYARPPMDNLLSSLSKKEATARSGRMHGSSIATTVEVNSQTSQQNDLRRVEKACADKQDAALSMENVAPVSRLKDFVLSATAASPLSEKEPNSSKSSPVATNVIGFTQGKELQELLNRRSGKKGDEQSIPSQIQDQPDPQKDPKACNAKSGIGTAEKEPEREPALKDDPVYSKYFKKKKMGLPLGAVKNAMERDGMDPAIMDLDPEKSLRAQSNATDGPPLKDDPEYTKYWKMLKMGLPVDAVKNALQRDGKDPFIIDLDPEKSLKSQRGGLGEEKDGSPPLCEDPEFSKYFRMLKMQLPVEAVKNALERDGKDSSIMDLDPNKSLKSQTKCEPKGGMRENIPPTDKFRRTRVHWETHDVVRSNTMWAMVARDSDVAKLNVNEEEFTSLFQAEPKPVQQSAPTAGATEQGAVKVIDKKRANNGGITLARIKLSYKEVAAAVDSYDDAALSQEQIRGVLQYLPTSEEKTALQNYLRNEGNSNVDGLCECEKFMVAIMAVKHAKQKLNAILYIQKFTSSLEELRRDARLVQKACDEIMGSSRLRKVLGVILNLGNRLNAAGSVKKESALAITLGSLLKLNQPRAFDKKTTFLQYVVSVVRRNDATLCHFKDDLATVFVAEKLVWDHTLAELKRIESQLEGVRRLALYHGSNKDWPLTSSRGSVGDDSATVLSIPTITVEQESDVLRRSSIGNFTLDACARMAAVVDEIENAKSSYKALLLYFGEEDKKGLQPHEVFQTISSFCRDFEAAVTVVVETETAQLREANRSRKGVSAPPLEPDESDGSAQSGEFFRRRASDSLGGVLNEQRCGKPNLNLQLRRRKHI